MFLVEFTSPQKRQFVMLANHIIYSDKKLHKKEKELMSLIYEEINLKSSNNISMKILPKVLKPEKYFKSKNDRIYLLIELVALAYADNTYSKEEKLLISDLGITLGIKPKSLKKIEIWVKKYNQLIKEIKKI